MLTLEKKYTQTNGWELFLWFYSLGLVLKHKLLLICDSNTMARNEACRLAKMQACLWWSFIIAVEMCGVKGTFAEPWAQLSPSSDFSFCQKILSLPS